MQELIIASRNRHKVIEISAILGSNWRIHTLDSLPNAPYVEETGQTFEENAHLKALAISAITDALVLADDSGLEVDALQGSPGVYSARYAGPDATDAANNALLLKNLATVPPSLRTARFRCVITLAHQNNIVATFFGSVEGHLLKEPTGHAGFGYDPLFVPVGYLQSFAELPPEEKNRLSHRAHALEQMAQWFNDRNEER